VIVSSSLPVISVRLGSCYPCLRRRRTRPVPRSEEVRWAPGPAPAARRGTEGDELAPTPACLGTALKIRDNTAIFHDDFSGRRYTIR
jgi:hypothetical protein